MHAVVLVVVTVVQPQWWYDAVVLHSQLQLTSHGLCTWSVLWDDETTDSLGARCA